MVLALFAVTVVRLDSVAAEPQREWSRIWGSAAADVAVDVAVVAGDGVYVAGWSAGSVHGQTNPGSRSALLSKYSLDGNHLWTRQWGPASTSQAAAVAVDGQGAIYVAGNTAAGFDDQQAIGNGDFFLSKFNAAGDRQWTRIWGSTSLDEAAAIAIDVSGRVAVAGRADGPFDGLPHSGSADLCLSVFQPDGSRDWSRLWGSASLDIGTSVASDADGRFYVGGFTFASIDGQAHGGLYDVVISCIEPDGARAWTRLWGGPSDQTAAGIGIGDEGEIYVVGDTLEGFNGVSGIGASDAFLMRISTAGDHQWTQIWGSSGTDFARGAVTAGPSVYAVGKAASDQPFDGEPAADAALFLSRHTTDGTRAWSRVWGGAQGTTEAVAFDGQVRLYAAGTTRAAFDGETTFGNNDVFLSCWDSGEPPIPQDSIESLHVLGSDFPLTLNVEASGDIDRVEFRANGELVGTSYGPVFEQAIDPAFLDQNELDFRGTNAIEAAAYRADGSLAGTMAASWVGDPEGQPPLISTAAIEDPALGTVVYTDADPPTVLFRVEATYLAADTDLVLPSGLPPSARSGRGSGELTEHPVEEVRFYVDGELVHTSTTPVPGYEHYHEVNYDLSRLSVGPHQLLVRVPATEAYRSSGDVRSFAVEEPRPEFRVVREVLRSDSHFEVSLRILNRGSAPGTPLSLVEAIQGYQICRISGAGSITGSSISYDPDSRECRATIGLDAAAPPIAPGSEIELQYAAVPILHPDGTDYAFGGSSAQLQYTENGTDVLTLPFAFTTLREEDGPVYPPLAAVVPEIIAGSDYLVLTDPEALIALYGAGPANGVLEAAAQLAVRRNGVMGYHSAFTSLRSQFREGDLIAVGDMFDAGDTFDQLFVGDVLGDDIRAYRRQHEVGNPDDLLPIHMRTLSVWDAMVAANFLGTDSLGDPNPQAELFVAQDLGTGEPLGEILSYQFRRGATATHLERTDFLITFEPGMAITAVQAWSPPRDVADLAVTGPGGVRIYDGAGAELGLLSHPFRAGDQLAAGNLVGDELSEIVIGDVHFDLVHIYFPVPPAGGGVSVYPGGDYRISQPLETEDEIAVGNFLGDSHDQIAVADASEDEVRIYAFDGSTAGFTLRETIAVPLEPGDVFTAARFTSPDRDQLVFFRVDGRVEVGTHHAGSPPGYANSIDTLINDKGAWASQLHPDWAQDGYLLIVGESDVIPTFSRTWDLLGVSAGRVDFTDRVYASTNSHRDNDRPELAVGRIIGNSARHLENTLRTTLEILDGTLEFNAETAIAAAGSETGPGEDSDDIDFTVVRDDIYDRLRSNWDFVIQQTEPSSGEFYTVVTSNHADVIFLAGHGSPWSWDVLDTDNVTMFAPAGAAPLFFAASCQTGRYGAGSTLAEDFLARGASAWIGATENAIYAPLSWGWCPRLASAFFDKFEPGISVGQALRSAKRSRLKRSANAYSWDWDYNRYHIAIFHLYGDPKLEPDWTPAPAPRDNGDPRQHFEGPLAEITLDVPAPTVESRDDLEHISIPGQPNLLVPGNPSVPSYTVTIDFPALTPVQSVALAERSAPGSLTDLDLPPVAAHIPDGETPAQPPPPGAGPIWPDPEFEWDIRNNPDGSTRLFITVYPVQYNADARIAQVTSSWRFDIDWAESPVSITSIEPSKAEFAPGDTGSATVEIYNGQATPADVKVTAQLRSDDHTAIGDAVSRELRGLATWGTWQHQWDGTGIPPGTYTLEFTVEDAQQQTVLDREQVLINVAGAAGQLLDLAMAPRAFHLGDNVQFSGQIENTGHTDLSGTVIFLVQSAAGQTAHSLETPFTDLAPDESLPVAITWSASLVPRDTTILAYAEFNGGVTATSVVADWRDAPLLWAREAIRFEGGNVVLSWPSVAGRSYTVFATPDLGISSPPTRVASDLPATPPLNTYPLPNDGPRRFFFVEENSDLP